MSIPTYGGSAVFGKAVTVSHVPNANAAQVAAFFGVVGVQAMDGGGRGRVFEISGLMTGGDPAGCVASELLLLTYADGIARILVDTTGTAWANVTFKGEYSRTGKFMTDCTSPGNWVLPYRAIFHGLT